MNLPLGRLSFYQEINQPDEQINLAKAALDIAQEEYPDLDPDEYLNALDTMAAEVQERLPAQRYPLRVIQTINQYLYDDLGFTGNNENYYDPRNSFLNDVIDRRTGIPIALALVYLEIARRIDFPMVGVGMPGHFLIRPQFEDVGIFVDAFHRGEILFEQDCRDRLAKIYQQSVQLQATFVEPVSSRRFLTRMLTNLKMIYLNRQELQKALATVERILLLFPDAPMELRDRGLLYFQMGRWSEASQDLNIYLAILPNAEDAGVIRQLLTQIEQDIY
ncbi:SirB1 family protein [Coleofasciculus sp. FACHB-64]|uniref:SirB1 family protein n=1 Tax=Cyanophyceae TaxID=3028117 RepID=UPI0016881501|nr:MULTISPECIES: SirB1 family protein [unclassified Coleofasciculus]MBD1838700.1 SirB1 family protein [Coleofasciculus sp. FACHB-501]MBD1879883.1 SirB1 family protein [Coleofasciculus sp. FACHB-T130]MBD2048818.1 SirB1 family protein [Coleofasciculus sp. FACHB-64]